MDQQNNPSKPVDNTQELKIQREVATGPTVVDLQPAILKELKKVNEKLGFFVVILILAIIIQFFSAILAF